MALSKDDILNAIAAQDAESARAAMAEGRSVILNAEIAIEAPRARPDVST